MLGLEAVDKIEHIEPLGRSVGVEQPPVTRYLVMQVQLLSLRACAGWQVVVRNHALK